MGQTFVRLAEKYFAGEDRSNKQESRVMLHDVTIDDADLTINEPLTAAAPTAGDLLETSKTPPNVLKLKCDPRSPNFDRTPLKIPLDQNEEDEQDSMLTRD